MANHRPPTTLVYLSCAPEDREHRATLERHLAPLAAGRGLRIWHRDMIQGGQDKHALAGDSSPPRTWCSFW